MSSNYSGFITPLHVANTIKVSSLMIRKVMCVHCGPTFERCIISNRIYILIPNKRNYHPNMKRMSVHILHQDIESLLLYKHAQYRYSEVCVDISLVIGVFVDMRRNE